MCACVRSRPFSFLRAAQGTVFYPIATGGGGPDRYNPVEHIIISNPVSGGNYTVVVRGVCDVRAYMFIQLYVYANTYI
jgi:hypothetical protein